MFSGNILGPSSSHPCCYTLVLYRNKKWGNWDDSDKGIFFDFDGLLVTLRCLLISRHVVIDQCNFIIKRSEIGMIFRKSCFSDSDGSLVILECLRILTDVVIHLCNIIRSSQFGVILRKRYFSDFVGFLLIF